MVKRITVFEATDGSRFDLRHEAYAYDKKYEKVIEILSVLNTKPSTDQEIVQHDLEVVKKVTIELLELFLERVDHHWIKQTLDAVKSDTSIDYSWVQRIIGEFETCYHTAWYRMCCINKTSGIEYNQQYYAISPEVHKNHYLESYQS